MTLIIFPIFILFLIISFFKTRFRKISIAICILTGLLLFMMVLSGISMAR
ncbi:hypothetical protein AM1H77_11540 [Apilactobacillus micheneri]